MPDEMENVMKTFLIATTTLATATAAFGLDDHMQADDPANTTVDQTYTQQTDDPVETDAGNVGEYSDDTRDDSEQDRDNFTDDHEWIDALVQSSDGVELGDVERVRLDASGEVDAIVVEYGGVLEIGGQETLIARSEFTVEESALNDSWSNEPENDVTGVDERNVNAAGFTHLITLNITRQEFESRPPFDEDQATDYPLADDDTFDGDASDEDPSGF